MQTIYPIKGRVQHYSWGGFQYIPSLLGTDNKEQQPFAEYWLGAHPAFPSTIAGTGETLATLFGHDGERLLGAAHWMQFRSLPFLLKVLDVRQMLSIQVHPSKEEAAKGYAAESKAGIALTAPHRNYKDENHKPEEMVALSDFWLLHGFKPKEALSSLLSSIPELSFLAEVLASGGYQGLYELVMNMPQTNVNVLLQPLADRILPLYDEGQLEKDSEHFWAARAIRTFCGNGNLDRGIFSIYFFNLVHLRKGEGIYQQAGMPHAYLEGQNMELMANSDNVLRGGLTDKHVAVDELMKHTTFEATQPQVLKRNAEGKYTTPAEEFELWAYEGNSDESFLAQSVEIIFILAGSMELTAGNEGRKLVRGEAALIAAGTRVRVSREGGAEFYRACIPGR